MSILLRYCIQFFSILGLLVSVQLQAYSTDSLKVVGQARLSILFWDVYDSTLYSPTGTYQPNQTPLALKINYLRDIEAVDLIEKTKDEWQHLGLLPEKINRWLPLLAEIFPDIKNGDVLLLRINERMQSELFYNGDSVGRIDDPLFGHQFLRIWLDEKCSYPKVCAKLRGR